MQYTSISTSISKVISNSGCQYQISSDTPQSRVEFASRITVDSKNSTRLMHKHSPTKSSSEHVRQGELNGKIDSC